MWVTMLCAAKDSTNFEQLPTFPLLVKQSQKGDYGQGSLQKLKADDYDKKVGLSLIPESDVTKYRRCVFCNCCSVWFLCVCVCVV